MNTDNCGIIRHFLSQKSTVSDQASALSLSQGSIVTFPRSHRHFPKPFMSSSTVINDTNHSNHTKERKIMNHRDPERNAYMLCDSLARRGYLRWWHSFTGREQETGAERTFFLEYLILNPTPGRKKKVGKDCLSYVRIAAGVFPEGDLEGCTLYSYHSVADTSYVKHPVYLEAGGNIFSENHLKGAITVSELDEKSSLVPMNAGTIRWNLEVHKTISCHTGLIASPLFCALRALDSFWHGEGIRAEFRGEVVLNDTVYRITPADSFGYADKHWGRSYNRPWLQLSCCRLYSERTGKLLKNSALAVDGCCPRFFCFSLKPKVMLQVTYTGEDFCYSFARPFLLSRVRWKVKADAGHFFWNIKALNRTSMAKLTVHCDRRDLLGLQYDEPDAVRAGSSRLVRTAGTGIGTLTLYRLTPSGKEWVDTLTIQRALCAYRSTPLRRASAK